jgi:hypothetical protein
MEDPSKQKTGPNEQSPNSKDFSVKSLLRVISHAPLTIFLVILAIGYAQHQTCSLLDDHSFLHGILGCDLVSGLTLHGH